MIRFLKSVFRIFLHLGIFLLLLLLAGIAYYTFHSNKIAFIFSASGVIAILFMLWLSNNVDSMKEINIKNMKWLFLAFIIETLLGMAIFFVLDYFGWFRLFW